MNFLNENSWWINLSILQFWCFVLFEVKFIHQIIIFFSLNKKIHQWTDDIQTEKYRVEWWTALVTREMNWKMIAGWEMKNEKYQIKTYYFKWNLCSLSFSPKTEQIHEYMNVWSTVQTEVRLKLLCLHSETKYEYDDWICVARLTITNDAICVLINTFDFPLFAYKIGEWIFFFFVCLFAFFHIDERREFVNECFFFLRFLTLSLYFRVGIRNGKVFDTTLVGDVRNAWFYYILHSMGDSCWRIWFGWDFSVVSFMSPLKYLGIIVICSLQGWTWMESPKKDFGTHFQWIKKMLSLNHQRY